MGASTPFSLIMGACLALARPAAADPLVPVRIGEVEFRVSGEAWHILQSAPGTGALLECSMAECGKPGRTATLSVRSPAAPCPAQGTDEGEAYGRETRFTVLAADAPGGLDFTWSETLLGCRNHVPPKFDACTVHNGRSCHLSTSGPTGCRSSAWGIPKDALIDLLRSARVGN